MVMGRLVFMLFLHLLQATLYPFSLLLDVLFYKKIWVVGIQFGKYLYRL